VLSTLRLATHCEVVRRVVVHLSTTRSVRSLTQPAVKRSRMQVNSEANRYRKSPNPRPQTLNPKPYSPIISRDMQ